MDTNQTPSTPGALAAADEILKKLLGEGRVGWILKREPAEFAAIIDKHYPKPGLGISCTVLATGIQQALRADRDAGHPLDLDNPQAKVGTNLAAVVRRTVELVFGETPMTPDQPSAESKTPLTDDEIETFYVSVGGGYGREEPAQYVPVEFARGLEAALAAKDAELAGLKSKYREHHAEADRLTAAITAAASRERGLREVLDQSARENKNTWAAHSIMHAQLSEVAGEYRRLLARLKEASASCERGHSQVAEELCHEFADFVSPALSHPSPEQPGAFTPPPLPFRVQPFDAKVASSEAIYVWYSWHPCYPTWSRSCWDGKTIEEASKWRTYDGAAKFLIYWNKLVKDERGVLTVIEDWIGEEVIENWEMHRRSMAAGKSRIPPELANRDYVVPTPPREGGEG